MSSVVLREVLITDIAIFFEHMQNKDQQWQAAFVSKDPANMEAHTQHWQKLMANPEVLNRTILHDGQVIGYIGRYFMDNVPQITYWVSYEYSGKGFTTSALELFLKLETQRPLEARTTFDNLASARVLEKNGFRITDSDLYFSNARNAEIAETIWSLG
jgi:RimJ/RimL family protein N-acetyltransferase